MQVPGNWESRGLPDFDGVVWFTRTIEAPQGAGEMTLSLGRISNTVTSSRQIQIGARVTF